MSDLYDRDQLACVEILTAWGIDPSRVTVNGVSETGYQSTVLDEDGHRKYDDDGNIIVVEHVWHSSFPVEEFLVHFYAWKKGLV